MRLAPLTAPFLLLVALLLAVPAGAEPTVAIDADPSAAGMQIAIEVIEGDAVAIDIWIQGIDVSEPLNAFELDLVFDDLVLSAQIIEQGDFLGEDIIVVTEEIDGGTVTIAYARIGAEGSEGSGIVASVIFQAEGVGTTLLQFENVILSGPFGELIIPFGSEGATIVVPEPGAVGLGLVAVTAVGCLAWRRRQEARAFLA